MAVLTLSPIQPFRLALVVWVLRRLPINEMDQWDGQTYRRVAVINDKPVAIAVTQTGDQLSVLTTPSRLDGTSQEQVRSVLTRMLGLPVDLAPFHMIARRDARLASLTKSFAGFHPPRLPSVFETLVNGIACQQLSLTVGIHLLNRLCRTFGPAIAEQHAFPTPATLAPASPHQLRSLGFSTPKAETILRIARAVADGELDLEGLSRLSDTDALERLLSLKGIGRWTAQYTLLRGLGRLDVFPADDVGSQNKMQEWLHRRSRPDYAGMYRILAPWKPYRGLIYFYLLLNRQRQLGLV